MAERPIFHDWKRAFNDDFGEPREKINLSLTRKQRNWVVRAWDIVFSHGKRPHNKHFCGFPVIHEDGGFYFCGWQKQIQIHHIMPKSYAYQVLGWDIKKINHPENLIPLCPYHHIGRGYKFSLDHFNEVVAVIHPDMEIARRDYKKGEKPSSYDWAMADRNELMVMGEIYWNDDWSQALVEKAVEVYHQYLNWQLETQGKYFDPFPERGK